MKILIASHFFHPRVGGTETVGLLLAGEFHSAGHEVRVVTSTPEPADLPYEVLRRPGPGRLLEAVRWCDVCLHNNVSLQMAWPLLTVRRPWLIAHHSWIPRTRELGLRPWLAGMLKRRVFRHARCVAVSRALADDIGVPAEIVPNPYRDDVFRPLPGVARDGDLVFAGRLVSQKGVDVLLRALAELRERGLNPRLTLVGNGPEEAALRALAHELRLEEQVVFDNRTGANLAQVFNAHRLAVIPSRGPETFGLVALEAMACGCVPVGAALGGLPEAIGPCGLLFEAGNAQALAGCMAEALTNGALRERLLAGSGEHLRPHRRKAVGEAYLRILEAMAG